MCNIAFEIPNEVLYDTRMNQKEAQEFARRAVAVLQPQQKIARR